MRKNLFIGSLAALAFFTFAFGNGLPHLSDGENPLIPMFVMSGDPSKDVLARELAKYRVAGIEQLLIYPRTGCEVEYMSPQWLENSKYIVEEGKRLGFTSVWLYDEFNYPSGTANKQTMKINPEFALHQLSAIKNADGSYGFEIVKNNEMPDLLNDMPVQCFIDLTHKKYFKAFGSEFGKTVKGIFSDEPSIAYFAKDKKYLVSVPYYKGLEEDYAVLTKGSLRADIECGLRTGTTPWQEPVSRLLGCRMADCFTKKIADWCRAHGIFSTGHLMAETEAYYALKNSGHPLDVLREMTFPGCDEVVTSGKMWEFEWLTFGTVMNAIEHNGNRGGLAELYALGPADISLANMRRQYWMCAAFGITRYVTAISQLDLRVRVNSEPSNKGAIMTVWFSSIAPSQPWFEKLGIMGDDAKKAVRFALKDREAVVDFLYPYKVVPMSGVLTELSMNQIPWRIHHEGEKPIGKYALAWNDRGIISGRIENNASWGRGNDIQAKIAQIREANPGMTRVELESGVLAPDIFLQLYKDGSVLAVDFSGTKRNLVLARDGKKLPFTMYPAGVLAIEKGAIPPPPDNSKFVENAKVDWKVMLDRPNTYRVDFRNSTDAEIELKCPMDLTFAIRQYGGAPKVLLDGEELSGNVPCAVLPCGSNNLYLQKTLKLSAGKHTLKLTNDMSDYPYMPLLIITGNFSSEKNILRPYANDGMGLYGYVGKIRQHGQITIPSEARFISAVTEGLTSELFVDGKSLGIKMWYPFKWEIPSDMNGKSVDVDIVRYTSIGRMFGSSAFSERRHEAINKNADWASKVLFNYRPRNDDPLLPFCPIDFQN